MIQFTPESKHHPSKVITEKGSEKTQDRILKLISKNNKISAINMALELNLSSRAIEKHLSQLVSDKFDHLPLSGKAHGFRPFSVDS